MAVERPISQQSDFLSAGRQRVPKQFVLQKKLLANHSNKKPVPNHLLDTKHFVKLSHNAVIQADPAEVHFAGFEPGKTFKQTLRLINLSSECQLMHVIPPSSRFFQAWYKKQQRLVPGMALEVTVEFTPDEWRYYYDCVRIHCQDADNLLVPIHGYPVMDTSDFPTVYSFPPTPVLQSKTKEIPLRCNVPVDFDFDITFPQPHPAFRVDPLSGVVPGQGAVFSRAVLAQIYKTKEIPLRCNVPVDFDFDITFPQPHPAFRVDPLSGVVPGQGAVFSRAVLAQIYKTKEIPLRCNVPVDFDFDITFPQPHPAFRVDPLSGVVPGQGEVTLIVTFTPTEFSTAVMKLQLNISQFNGKPVVCTITGNSVPGIEQKEASLKVKTTTTTDFDSQLDPHSISPLGVARKKRSKKTKAAPTAGVLQKEGLRFPSNLDAQHSVNTVLNQQAGKMSYKELKEAIRTGNASAVNRYQLKEAEFDQEVKNDVKRERKNELRWQVHVGEEQITAVERDQILTDRLEAVSQYHRYRGDPEASSEYTRTSHSRTEGRTSRSVTDIPSASPQFDPFTNDSWSFRHRTLGRFRSAVNKVILRSRAEKKIPLIRKLVTAYNAGEINDDQTTVNLADVTSLIDIQLRISAEVIASESFPKYTAPDHKDDMAPDALGIVPCKAVPLQVKQQVPFLDLKVPQQYKLMGYSPHSARDAGVGYVPPRLIRPLRVGAEDEIIQSETWVEETDTQLAPPPGLFKPTEYHPLHIFNPAPGLQVFLPPMPYAETDPDFHLNPLPRYTHPDSANKHGTTLRNFLDREDTIKGVMTWKKFPSQGLVSLANTPTLLSVWVPRWTDPFNEDILPSDVPELLESLPETDRVDIVTEDEEEATSGDAPPMLTPSMVNAQFPLITTECTTEGDEFESKLPAHNNPVSSTGRVPREQREQDLETFLQKRNNRLGEKINTRVEHMNSLLNNSQLKLA